MQQLLINGLDPKICSQKVDVFLICQGTSLRCPGGSQFYIWTFNLSCLTSEKRSRIKYMYINYPTLKPKHKKHNSTSWNRSNLFHLLEIRITPVWVVTTNFVVGGIESLMVVYPPVEENTTHFHLSEVWPSIPLDLPIYVWVGGFFKTKNANMLRLKVLGAKMEHHKRYEVPM